ncbi:MAG: cation acetate symporter [Planctomycetes bacterium]|nr:cation acetate symporter [Planctomycetota bacterium]
MDNLLVVGFVGFFILASIVITWWSSRSTKSASEFYVAGKGVPWVQVGIAMVGSYLSAASFLGCPGDIGVFGIDSIWLSIGFFGGYMALLMLIAGPLRNVGSFTVAGALARRFPDDKLKLAVMVCTIVVSTFYLVPQMLGAGLLFEMLMGWDFLACTIGLGVLMCFYIVFGGMKSTLYNQVIQALFLWAAMVVLTVMAFFLVGGGSLGSIFATADKVVPPDAVSDALVAEYRRDPAAARSRWPKELEAAAAKARTAGEAAVAKAEESAFVATAYKDLAAQVKEQTPEQAIAHVRARLPEAASAMTIGVKTGDSLAILSTVIALVFGTAGLPHILIMFFTVPSARAAKKSVTLCIVALGIFYLCAIILGFLLFPAIYPKLIGWISQGGSGVGLAKNMAVLEISQMVGGKWLMAIGAAGAVAAILSTAAGLMITVAGTVSNDLYKVYINTQASEKQELMIARITTVLMSAIAVVLAVMLKKENIAWLVMLGFGIAASAIFPGMLGTLWWRGATRQGVIASIVTGLVVSCVFIVLLLTGVPTFLGLPTSGGPGVFGVTAGFLALFLVSKLTSDYGKDPEAFLALAHKPDAD